MADNNLGDPRVAQDIPASQDQVEALRQKYTPKASATPTTGAPPDSKEPIIGKAAGAKVLQSATFGFGADAARLLINRQAEHSIRELSKKYDDDHPLAAFGIDLAVAGAMSAIPGAGEAKDAQLAASGLKMIGKASATGAAVGGLSGAGAGGDIGQRGQQAVQGALAGGAMGAGAAYAGAAMRPIMQKLGLSSAQRGAAGAIQEALKKDGKSPSDLDAFMKTNPSARIADFSPKVAEAIGKVSAVTQKASNTLGDTVREDKGQQATRLLTGAQTAQPLEKTKKTMMDNIDALRGKMKEMYDVSKTEIAPMTAELKSILSNPAIKTLYDKAIEDYDAGRKVGLEGLRDAPKYRVGEEIPSAALDDLQKEIGRAAKVEDTGSTRYGTLKAAQKIIKNEQAKSGSITDAHALAAQLGGVESETGVLGAQQWGHQYAFGIREADVGKFRSMNEEQREYAKLGMVHGLEEYLNDAGRMTEGSLTKISDKLRSPQVDEVLGPKIANQVRKEFLKEAARMRVSSQMESGGNRRAAFKEQNDSGMVAHAANVAIGGAGHILGTGMRILAANNISEKQAMAMVDIATRPGGLQRLQKSGVDKRVLDVISAAAKRKGLTPGKLASEANQREQR